MSRTHSYLDIPHIFYFDGHSLSYNIDNYTYVITIIHHGQSRTIPILECLYCGLMQSVRPRGVILVKFYTDLSNLVDVDASVNLPNQSVFSLSK